LFVATTSNVSITADDAAIPPRRIARVALLADPDAPPQFDWQVGAVSCWMFLSEPLELRPYAAQVEADRSWAYGEPGTVRGVRYWNMEVCYTDIGVPLSAPGSIDFSQLDDLGPDEMEPQPLTIGGWD
ncbi:MAG TPA: hypothetical protein VI258_09260, partial [Rhodanobacteraceae bacterium]